MTQVPIPVSAVVAGWLLFLGWRKKSPPEGAIAFDLVQLVIPMLTIVALGCLAGSIVYGLVGAPEMQIAGNGSSASDLIWYHDRVAGTFPAVAVASVPLMVYRIAMLAWSLWAAASLIRWLVWGWSAFTSGGVWKRGPKATPPTRRRCRPRYHREVMRRALLVVFCLPLLAAAKPKAKDPYDPGDLWSDASVLRELNAAEKALDDECGKIPKRPRILLSTRQYAFEQQVEDMREFLDKVEPGASDAYVRAEAAEIAISAFAFYEPNKNTVHILPENFAMSAKDKKDPTFVSPEFLRMVLVHELTHAYDTQERGLEVLRESLRKPEQFKIFGAVSEGHAHDVTRKVMTKMGRGEFFDHISDINFAPPSDPNDPGLDFLRQRAAESIRFGYVDGVTFWQGLADAGKPELLDQPFQRMPSSIGVVLHPERYWDPPQGQPMPIDYAPIAKSVIGYAEPTWRTMRIPVDEHTLRAAAEPLLDKSKVEALLADLVSGSGAAGGPSIPRSKADIDELKQDVAGHTPRPRMVCAVYQMRDEEGGKRLLGMLKALVAAEDQRFASANELKLTVLADGELELASKLPNFRHARFLLGASGARIAITTIYFQRKELVAGCDFYSLSHRDDILADVAGTFADELGNVDTPKNDGATPPPSDE